MAIDPGRVDPLVGQVVGGRYEIVRRIGKGGMGAIYEVRNTRLGGRSYALKALAADAARDDDLVARFRREAEVISRLKHPNVVDVIDWESLADGSPCMVMEYLQGEDLGQRIYDESPLPWPFIARVGDQVLSALSVAHDAGVIHRDLKPQNVFLAIDDSGEERAKLLDFGVSKIRDSRSVATTDARLIGTPSYMAPEQAEGSNDDVGPGTDVWAMGAMLYEMATGELAFDGPNLPQILYRICTREPEPVNVKRADAPPAFVELIQAVMSRDPGTRIVDADVLRLRLREALRDVANFQYPEVMRTRSSAIAIPVTPVTPLPMRQPSPSTPRRRKRFTDALTETVASGSAAIPVIGPEAPPAAAGPPQLVTLPSLAPPQITMPSAATIARRPSWRRWLGVTVIAVAAIAVVFVILIVVRDRSVSARRAGPPPAADPAPPDMAGTILPLAGSSTVAPDPGPTAGAGTGAAIGAAAGSGGSSPTGATGSAAGRPGTRIKKPNGHGDTTTATTTTTTTTTPSTVTTPDKPPDKPTAGSNAKCVAHPDDPMCAFGTDQ